MEKRSLVWEDDNSDEAQNIRKQSKINAQGLYGRIRAHIDPSLPLEMEINPKSLFVTFHLDGLVYQMTSFYELCRVRNIEDFARHMAENLLALWVAKKYWKETRG
jgi:hypothetical protein